MSSVPVAKCAGWPVVSDTIDAKQGGFCFDSTKRVSDFFEVKRAPSAVHSASMYQASVSACTPTSS